MKFIMLDLHYVRGEFIRDTYYSYITERSLGYRSLLSDQIIILYMYEFIIV